MSNSWKNSILTIRLQNTYQTRFIHILKKLLINPKQLSKYPDCCFLPIVYVYAFSNNNFRSRIFLETTGDLRNFSLYFKIMLKTFQEVLVPRCGGNSQCSGVTSKCVPESTQTKTISVQVLYHGSMYVSHFLLQSHLSNGSGDRKQNEKKSFSVLLVICFAASVSSRNHLLTG